MIRQVYKDAKTFFHIALWLVILLIVVMSSKSVLGLSAELAADNNVISGETAIILFGSDDYTASHELKIDGTPVATSSPYNWLTTDGDIGSHSLLVTATAQNGLISTAQQTITVESANAALSIEEPSKTEYTNTPIPVLLLVNDVVTVCEASLGGETVALTKNGNFFSGEMNPVDGIYTLSVLCMAGATQIEDSHTLLVDTQAPETLSSNVHNGNSIVIETSEVATCRAWRESNSESTAQEMTSVDRLTHTLTISAEGSFTYLARCKDIYGNTQTSTTSFSVENADEPSARIELLGNDDEEEKLEEDAVLSAGSYKLVLRASEAVEEPVLTFSYQGGTERNVALSKVGSGVEWNGYLVVTENDGEQVGSFSVELTDLQGMKGTEISAGKLFLVDTKAPEKLEGLTASVKEGTEKSFVLLTWAAEDNVDYVVYRSLKDRLNKGDEIAQAFTNEYEDREAGEGGTYFYSVAARDKAGNTGPFGAVVVAVLTPTALRTSDTERAYYIDETLAKIDVAITNIETESETLANTNDELKVMVIEKAGLLTKLEKKASELRISRDELATIGQDFPEAEFQTKLDEINTELSSVSAIIPKRITIDGSVTYEQASDTKTQNLLIAKAEDIFSTDLESAALRSAYQDAVQQLMDGVRVDSHLVTANVLFSDRSEKDYVYVEKQILLPRQQEPLALIEYIPKTVIDDADLIQWDPLPVIVERDPIVKYTIPSGETTFSLNYFFEKKLDVVTARATRTILMPEPDPESVANSITGEAVTNQGLGGASWFYLFGGLLIAGLLIYYLFVDNLPGQAFAKTDPTTSSYAGLQSMYPAPQVSQQSLDSLTKALIGAFERVKPTMVAEVSGAAGAGVVGSQKQSYFERRASPADFFKKNPFSRQAPSKEKKEYFERRSIIPRSEAEAFEKSVEEFSSPMAKTVVDSGRPELTTSGALLLQGHEHIDKKEYIPAKSCYAEAIEQLKEECSQGVEPSDAKKQAGNLYYKLLLYKQMQSAFSAANDRNRALLDGSLKELRSIAQRLPEEESMLITEAKEKYRSLYKLSNKIAIEDEKF